MNNLTSNSEPVGPKLVFTSTVTGNFKLDELVAPTLPLWNGNKSTPYPANTNLPSGGTKLSSPGLSRHLASRTHGWKTGSSITLFIFCLPEGVERFNSKSGTPEILDVKAIVPFANAAKGRPEGARVTDSVSTRSTYNSLDVCRTLARRHGNAGVFAAKLPDEDIADILELVGPDEKPGFLKSRVKIIHTMHCT